MQLEHIIGMAAVTGEAELERQQLGRQLLVSVLWIFSARLLQLWLWLSILRKWLRLSLRWLLSVLRKLGILPLPLRILAVREL